MLPQCKSDPRFIPETADNWAVNAEMISSNFRYLKSSQPFQWQLRGLNSASAGRTSRKLIAVLSLKHIHV